MALRTVRSFVSRARHVIAFIAIVWGVAATFVAFEVVSLSAVDLALRYPALVGDLMLSRTVTESTSCEVAAGSERPQPSISEADARVGPWLLGLSLGRDALFRQYAPSNRQVLDQLAKDRDDLAARLAVRAPEAFTPEQFANANTEFVAFVEQGGAAETARQLAATHSPRACELFKLGAVGLLGNGPARSSRGTRGVRNGDPSLREADRRSGTTVESDAASHPSQRQT